MTPPAPPGPGAGGADLLGALAFCVTGTWRQVGPAFVLTDDIAGIGTRTQLWREFEKRADALRAGPVQAAGEALLHRHDPAALSWFGDPTALTDAQRKPGPHWGGDPRLTPSVDGPLSSLTPAQQDMARRAADEFSHEYEHQYKEDELTPPGPQTRVMLYPSLQVELLLPTEAAPISMNLNVSQLQLFRTPPETPAELQKRLTAQSAPRETPQQYLKEHPEVVEKLRQENPTLLAKLLAAPPPPPPGPPPTLGEVLKAAPRRAVLLRAQTATQAAQDVAALVKLGVTEFWLRSSRRESPASPARRSPPQPRPPGDWTCWTGRSRPPKGRA